MISVTVEKDQLNRLASALKGASKKLPKETAIAVNKTASKGQLEVARVISEELATAQKNFKDTIDIALKATGGNLKSLIRLKKTKRMSLRLFGARQTSEGVSYKISKKGGRKVRINAFQGPRLGLMKMSWKGSAFRRSGKSRLPIWKQTGPSPFGVFVKNHMGKKVKVDLSKELEKQIERRIRFHVLKSQGKLNYQQK